MLPTLSSYYTTPTQLRADKELYEKTGENSAFYKHPPVPPAFPASDDAIFMSFFSEVNTFHQSPLFPITPTTSSEL